MPPLASLALNSKPKWLVNCHSSRWTRTELKSCPSGSPQGVGRTKWQGTTAGDPDAHGKRRGGKGRRCCRGLLQQAVCGTKTRRDVPAHTGSLQTEQVLGSTEVQIGQPTDGQICGVQRCVDGESRFERCLLPHTYSSRQQEVPEVQGTRSQLPVPCTPVRPLTGSLCVHTGCKQCSGTLEKTRSKSDYLPRRLDTYSKDPCYTVRSGQRHLFSFEEPGLCHQQRKEPVDSGSELCVPGRENRHNTPDDFSFSAKLRAHGSICETNIQLENSNSSESLGLARTDEFLCHSDHQGTIAHEAGAVLADGKMETNHWRAPGRAQSGLTTSANSNMVVGERSQFRIPPVPGRTQSHDSIRCIFSWLGRCSGRGPGSLRRVESFRADASHKLAGAESSVQCTERVSASTAGLNSIVPSRQLYSGDLHQEGGRYQIPATLPTGVGTSDVVRCSTNSPTDQTHSRKDESCVGQPVQGRDCNRVVDPPSGDESCFQNLGHSDDRSVCNQPESQTQSILQPTARPGVGRGGLTESQLGRTVRVCLPPVSDSSNGAEESSKGALYDHPYCATMASEKLVLSNPESADSATSQDSANGQTSVPERQVPCKTRDVQLPRLVAFKRSRTQEGFSEKAASYAGKCVRDSSQAVYAGKWRVYSDWCDGEQINPLTPTSAQLIDFLIYLFEDRKLSVSSIKGYRSAISHVLGRSYPKDSTDMMGEVLRGMTAVANTPAKSRLPKWDMTVVLNHLSKPSTNLR